MSKTYVLDGRLAVGKYGEGGDILFCGHSPVAEWASNFLSNKKVSIRYWVTDKPCTLEEAQEDFLQTLFGAVDTKFGARYSDLTGYLWTDEDFNVGGHDMIQRLKSEEGRYLLLEAVTE